MIGDPSNNTRCGEAGFTLVEVLVVLALLALLMGALFGSLRFGLHAWQQTTSHTTRIDHTLLVQDFLRRSLGNSYPAFIMDDAIHGHVDFQGSATSMSFLAPTPTARGVGGRSRFTLSLEGEGTSKALVVTAQPELLPPDATPSSRDILLDGLDEVEFSYLGATGGGGAAEWHDDWSSPYAMPRLVRIRVKYPPGDTRVWADLVIAPRIDVDVGCVYDPLTRRCRGR